MTVRPLRWKTATFRIAIQDHGEHSYREVRGVVAGVFGIHREGRHSWDGFILTHRPTGTAAIELRRRRDCQAFAEELRKLRLNLNSTNPREIILGTPDADKAAALFKRYQDANQSEAFRRMMGLC